MAEYDFESLLKGGLAEILVARLLVSSGNTVIRFGYEWRTQAWQISQLIMDSGRVEHSPRKLKSAPDLQVINRDGKESLVEVKFRENGQPFLCFWKKGVDDEDDEDRFKLLQEHWPDTRVVIVGLECEQPRIKVHHPPFVRGHGSIIRPILLEEEWGINRQVCDECERWIEKLYRLFYSKPSSP